MSTQDEGTAGPTRVRLEVVDGVALVTLDGPRRLNAFAGSTGDELSTVLARCDADDAVRVVVITGAGRAFCSGADMAEAAMTFATPDHEFSSSPLTPPPYRVRKLVIAAVNGHAIGIGLTIALQCDLRIVADDAQLSIPQVRRGVMPDAQSHLILRRMAGTAVAAELLLTGRTFSGEEAARVGVANRAMPAVDVLSTAMEIARDVAVNANPASVAVSKAVLWGDVDLEDAERAETVGHHWLMGRPDAFEGPAAWRDRRRPEWTSRVSELPADVLAALLREADSPGAAEATHEGEIVD